MQKAMKEIVYFQKLKEMVGKELFVEGVELAKLSLQSLSYTEAKKLFISTLCRALLLDDVETAKKYAVALEVLEDFRKNQRV
jgi:hypothetical protein